ncbi:MAG: GyrI-like domain-containing protein [Nigerium sp.]|nr:GyrI-like domain-containing protein [Nigerium sp.]
MSVNPRIDTIGAWIAAGVRQTIPMSELSTVFPEIYQKVARAVLAADGHLRGPAYGCYFGMPTDTVDVEIGFGIDRELELPGITVTAWPEAQAVVGTHIGPYDDLARSYEELGAWMSAQNVPLADYMWEFYDSPPDTDPAETVTRMVFPLKP